MEKLEKHFCHLTLFNHISIVTAVSNVRFQDCCLYRMSHKQSYHLPMITNISKSKDLIGPSPGKSERGILKEKNQNDQDFCWACNFNPRIFSTWMTSQMYSFQICRVFLTYEDFKVIRKGFAICNLSCINLRVFCLIALLSHTAYNFLFWTVCNINIWQRMSLSSMIYRASCQIILTKTKTPSVRPCDDQT